MAPSPGTCGTDLDVSLHLGRVAQRYRIDRAAAEACATLSLRGIPAMLLKGPATARVLYEGEERFYCDADILVAPKHLGAASLVLEELGFIEGITFTTPFRRWAQRQLEGKDRGLLRESDGVTIELHRSFHLLPAASNLHAVLAHHRDSMQLARTTVDVPNRAAVGVLCLLHAYSSRSQSGQTERISSDVVRAIDQITTGEWAEAAAIATELKVQRCCVAVLLELGGAPGAAVARQHFPKSKADWWLTTHLRTGSPYAYRWMSFRSRTWRSRAMWCISHILPGGTGLREGVTH
jgi:Uncharacterised nucleotidyltransferase